MAGNDVKKLKQVQLLLDDEIGELLETLDRDDIQEYAEEELEMIHKDDQEELVEALDYLGYDFINEVDTDDMIKFLEKERDLIVKEKADEFEADFDNVDYQLFSDIYNKFQSSNTFERQELRNKVIEWKHHY